MNSARFDQNLVAAQPTWKTTATSRTPVLAPYAGSERPERVLVRIAGSTWGGSMLKMHFVGRGMHLEFKHPEYDTPIITSRILEIRECVRDSRAEDFVGMHAVQRNISERLPSPSVQQH